MYFRLHYVVLVVLATNTQFVCRASSDDLPDASQLVISDDSHRSTFKDITRLRQNDTLKSKENPPSQNTQSPTPPKPVTVPTIPSPATATMSPGGKDLSKVINLLFAILFVVTAILLVITGVCVMDLHRRYLSVSQPCYDQLKSIPV